MLTILGTAAQVLARFLSLHASGVACLLAVSLVTHTVQAQDDLYPGIIGKDDRVAIDAYGPPWNAIGHVNVAGYRARSICTGTLIAPRVVLTAAHCVIDPAKGEAYRLDNFHFVAGVYRDKSAGMSAAECLKFPAGYNYKAPNRLLPDLPSQPVPFDFFRQNLAIIVLKNEIPGVAPIEPLSVAKFRADLQLTHAAYPADRRYILQLHKACRPLWSRDGVLATDCDSHGGASGGPLLVEQEGNLRLLGVMVGVVPRSATLFASVADWPDLPLNADCP